MNESHSIYWTIEAEKTYIDALAFILKRWTIKEATHFELLTEELLKQLSTNLKLCPEIKKLNIRKCVVSEQTSLIYRIQSQSIELIAFIDNRSQHRY